MCNGNNGYVGGVVWHENENERARMLAPEPAAEHIEIMAPARLRGSRRSV